MKIFPKLSLHSLANCKSLEPQHDKTNEMICVPSEDSDQPGHPTSLIRVFAVCMKKAWALSYPLSTQRRLWSDWADAQADLSLRWVHMPFCWFCHEAAHFIFTCSLFHDCVTVTSFLEIKFCNAKHFLIWTLYVGVLGEWWWAIKSTNIT